MQLWVWGAVITMPTVTEKTMYQCNCVLTCSKNATLMGSKAGQCRGSGMLVMKGVLLMGSLRFRFLFAPILLVAEYKRMKPKARCYNARFLLPSEL